jgi:ABC-type branched-subunit amino acid transport system substrate-binding protein
MKSKWFLIISACVILVLAVLPFMTVCPAQAEVKTLKIGCPRCVTGFYSEADTLSIQGDKLFEKWINERGGITINGQKYNINMVIEDIKGTADGAVAAGNNLVYKHGVKFISGPAVPYMVEGVGAVSEKAGVLRVVQYNCYLPNEFGPKTPYTFLAPVNSIIGTEPTLDYLKEAYPDVKKIAWTLPDDGSIPYLRPRTEAVMQKAGYKIVGFIGWAHTTVDWMPTATKLLGSKPDGIIMMNGGPAATGGIFRAIREQGFDGPVAAAAPDNVYALLAVAGAPVSDDLFIHCIVAGHPDMTPAIKEIIELGLAAGYDVTGAPDWIRVMCASWPLVQAIEKAQSTDPAVVKEVFEKMDKIETPFGTGTMCGLETYGIKHAITSPQPLCALENGKVVWIKWQPAPSIP